MAVVFRPLKIGEAALAAAVEKECLDTAWSEEQIKNIPENAFYIGAFEDDWLCGIASAYIIAGEGQIMNVAVSPDYRRRGIALGLMNEIISKAVENGCENITLEVAENNASAISLYEKCGFSAVGKRKGFYGNESAIIMEKLL